MGRTLRSDALGKKQKNKMKPTNPNAHTYDNQPRKQSYVMREEKGSVKCGVEVESVEC